MASNEQRSALQRKIWDTANYFICPSQLFVIGLAKLLPDDLKNSHRFWQQEEVPTA